MPSRCWAIKLASARYFESEVFLTMAACKPTTARTPMEKIRIAISDSSNTTPCWDAGEETGLLPFIYFSSLTFTWVGSSRVKVGIAHPGIASYAYGDAQFPALRSGKNRRINIHVQLGGWNRV